MTNAGDAPEYNTVDAALWYIEAVRAFDEATGARFVVSAMPGSAIIVSRTQSPNR